MKPPLPHSYWVEPGRLLAGEHPHGGDEALTRERLATLLQAGVRHFIDLTEPHELPSYEPLLPPGTGYERHAIRDHSVPAQPAQMRAVQVSLERALAREGAVYVHCRAGIGRTGITVGCYLREQGESADGALTELNRLWQQNARAARWPWIPETEEQEQFIRRWQSDPLDARTDASASGLHRLSLRPLQRFRGCLTGLAVGDALAAAAGEGVAHFTDDTGLALCVGESLLARGGFDGRDQLERYREWARDPAVHGAAPDAAPSPAVRGVLGRALWSRSPVIGTHDPAQLDPSPFARAAMAALFVPGRPGQAAALGADIARVTHQSPVLVDACRLLAAMLSHAVAGQPRTVVLQAMQQLGGIPLRDEVRLMAADWLSPPVGRRRPPAGVLGVLDRAVRCFARSRGFEDGLQRALDSRSAGRDALCAVYGALAGAFHGEAAIPSRLRARVAGLTLAGQLAERLYAHGSQVHGAAV